MNGICNLKDENKTIIGLKCWQVSARIKLGGVDENKTIIGLKLESEETKKV